MSFMIYLNCNNVKWRTRKFRCCNLSIVCYLCQESYRRRFWWRLFVCLSAGTITQTKSIFNSKLPLIAIAEHCLRTCRCFHLDENLSGMFSGAVVMKMYNIGVGHCELLSRGDVALKIQLRLTWVIYVATCSWQSTFPQGFKSQKTSHFILKNEIVLHTKFQKVGSLCKMWIKHNAPYIFPWETDLDCTQAGLVPALFLLWHNTVVTVQNVAPLSRWNQQVRPGKSCPLDGRICCSKICMFL